MKKLISLALAAVLALGILSGCGKKADAAIQIAVPNDTTNEARALLLLQENGIIKLADGAGITATKNGASFEWVATAKNGWHAVVVNGQVGWVSGEFSSISR